MWNLPCDRLPRPRRLAHRLPLAGRPRCASAAALALTAALLACAPHRAAADTFYDNATTAPYDDGFQAGDNGNLGTSSFAPWVFITTGTASASIGASGGVIEIAGESWVIDKPLSSTIAVQRSFTPPTPSPRTVIIVDADTISGQGRVELFNSVLGPVHAVDVAATEWRWADSVSTPSGIPGTRPIRIKWLLRTTTTLDSTITDLTDGTVVTSTGRTLAGGATSGTDVNRIFFTMNVPPASAQALGFNGLLINSTPIDYQDDASFGVYGDGWTSSFQDNGDTGGLSTFQPWVLTLPGGSTATAASAGNTDVNGVSFRVFHGGGGTTAALRSFAALTPSPTTIVQFTAILSGGTGAARLRDTSGISEALRLEDSGGLWAVTDGTGTSVSPFASTSGVRFSALVNGTTTYGFAITQIASGTTFAQSGRMLNNSVTGNALGQLLFQPNSGATLSFNSLKIDSTGTLVVPVELSAFGLE